MMAAAACEYYFGYFSGLLDKGQFKRHTAALLSEDLSAFCRPLGNIIIN
jgi:hypothetical protein